MFKMSCRSFAKSDLALRLQATLPQGKGAYTPMYITFMLSGSLGMLVLNAVWWTQLERRRRQMSKGTQSGQHSTAVGAQTVKGE